MSNLPTGLQCVFFFLWYVRPHLCSALHQPKETVVYGGKIVPRFQLVSLPLVDSGEVPIDDAFCRFELLEANIAPEVVEDMFGQRDGASRLERSVSGNRGSALEYLSRSSPPRG